MATRSAKLWQLKRGEKGLTPCTLPQRVGLRALPSAAIRRGQCGLARCLLLWLACVPAIHAYLRLKQGVDARHEAGHAEPK